MCCCIGHPRFTFSDIRAGDVIAYTVNIRNFELSLLPMEFETLISLNDGTMQVCLLVSHCYISPVTELV